MKTIQFNWPLLKVWLIFLTHPNQVSVTFKRGDALRWTCNLIDENIRIKHVFIQLTDEHNQNFMQTVFPRKEIETKATVQWQMVTVLGTVYSALTQHTNLGNGDDMVKQMTADVHQVFFLIPQVASDKWYFTNAKKSRTIEIHLK